MFPPDLIFQIALTMAPEIGAITAKKLIKATGSARAVFMEKKAVLMQIPGIGSRLSRSLKTSMLMKEAEQELKFLQKHGIKASYFEEEDYPERLKQCQDGPVLLYQHGRECLLGSRILSVVGTRDATSYGKDVCRALIYGLSEMFHGVVIVSGLAYGIDISAHKAALENDMETVAVLGHGLSTIYPSVHRDFAKRIIHQGVLVTDFHSGITPERNNFLRRNRIIAGLSDATLVIESGAKGGALITADIAGSYHREVMAVPGRINDPKSMGCNNLIKQNLAVLVETPSDIVYNLNWTRNRPSGEAVTKLTRSLTNEEELILACIREIPGIPPEIISNRTGIPIHLVLSRLVEMELNQWITVMPGNRYQLRVKLQ